MTHFKDADAESYNLCGTFDDDPVTDDWSVVDCGRCIHRAVEDGQGHWAGHPNDVADWQYEVANGDTRLGFHEWVAVRDGERIDR